MRFPDLPIVEWRSKRVPQTTPRSHHAHSLPVPKSKCFEWSHALHASLLHNLFICISPTSSPRPHFHRQSYTFPAHISFTFHIVSTFCGTLPLHRTYIFTTVISTPLAPTFLTAFIPLCGICRSLYAIYVLTPKRVSFSVHLLYMNDA